MKEILPVMLTYGGISGYAWLRMLFLGALCLFCYILYRRFSLIRLGQKDPRWNDCKKRLFGLVKDGFIQLRQLRYRDAGIIHIMIFWGFVVLGLHSVNLLAGGMIPGFSFSFMKGTFGTAYNSVKDFMEMTTLAGCLVALYRRAILKPKRYEESRQFEAYLVLSLISFLMITDLLYEGSQLGLNDSGNHLLLGAWIFSQGISFFSPDTIKIVHVTSYWVHVVVLLIFLNLLPLSKHFHIITALPNVFFRKQVRGCLKPVRYDRSALDQLTSAGVRKTEDFTWKHILDFFSCTECGRCTDNCPANRIGRYLSPKNVTMRLRNHGYDTVPVFGRTSKNQKMPIAGGVISDEELWNCTTCGACEEQCPVFIEHVDKIIEMRRHRVLMKSVFPAEFKPVFKKLEVFGDTLGKGGLFREEWTSGLKVKRIYEDGPVDLVFWTGCMGPFYDEQSKGTLKAAANVLNRSELNWAILGKQELCCGDWARRVGNEYLYQQLARQNIDVFSKYNIKKIVTNCPHCYNTLKNEYPRLGARIEVLHFIELMEQMWKTGKLNIHAKKNQTYTYHDPCYLGRYHSIYQEPRNILHAVCGPKLPEMARSKEQGFCCGAGGGNFWRGGLVGQRMEEVRIEEALATGAKGIVTACPYCKIMLGSAIKQKGYEHTFPVLDVCEVIQ